MSQPRRKTGYESWIEQERIPVASPRRRRGSRHSLLGGLFAHVAAMKEGGTLIEYEDEDPEIRRIDQTELKSKNITFAMPESQ
jgi:hypothetical protein